MARRGRIRNRNSVINNGGFSIANMREDFTTANDTLIDAIAAQNPNVDADGFETELRELVGRYGRGVAGIPPGFPAIASAQTTTKPEYNLAGDLLVAASAYLQDKNYKGFFQSVRDAFRAQDAHKLLSAIAEMNSMTEVEDQAKEDEEFNDLSDPSISAGFHKDFEPVEDEDEENDDPLARDKIMSGLDSNKEPEVPVTTDTLSDIVDPTASSNTSENQKALVAFLNKITLSGTQEDRKKAERAVRRAIKN